MPCMGLRGPPTMIAASAALASARARAAVRVTKLSSRWSSVAIRDRVASASSTGDNLRVAIRRAASAMVRKGRSDTASSLPWEGIWLA